VLIERDPHLGEVVQVASQAEADATPLESLRFRRSQRVLLISPFLTAARMATQSGNGQRAGHQHLARLDEFVLLHPRHG
jgi:hypothetical protein